MKRKKNFGIPKTFLYKKIVCCIGIAHAIMIAVRPKYLLSSIQISFSTYVCRKFGSNKIIFLVFPTVQRFLFTKYHTSWKAKKTLILISLLTNTIAFSLLNYSSIFYQNIRCFLFCVQIQITVVVRFCQICLVFYVWPFLFFPHLNRPNVRCTNFQQLDMCPFFTVNRIFYQK